MRQENVFIGLGSNIGNRLDYLLKAAAEIANLPGTKIVRRSSVYESAPLGRYEQRDFLNTVMRVSTSLSPEHCLEKLQRIETGLNRVRDIRWGPRTIDIDILFWGHETRTSRSLQLPHPEVAKRRFVLQPLNEIAASFLAPPQFVRIGELLDLVADPGWVRLYRASEEYEEN